MGPLLGKVDGSSVTLPYRALQSDRAFYQYINRCFVIRIQMYLIIRTRFLVTASTIIQFSVCFTIWINFEGCSKGVGLATCKAPPPLPPPDGCSPTPPPNSPAAPPGNVCSLLMLYLASPGPVTHWSTAPRWWGKSRTRPLEVTADPLPLPSSYPHSVDPGGFSYP